MGLKTYDSKLVSVIVGTKPLSGFADGSFVNASRDADDWAKSVGADGETTRSKSNNKAGKIVITLKQSSDSNDYLSGLAVSGAVVPVLVRDASGRTVIGSESGWVLKPADAEFGKEAGDREWTIDCADLNMFVAGN